MRRLLGYLILLLLFSTSVFAHHHPAYESAVSTEGTDNNFFYLHTVSGTDTLLVLTVMFETGTGSVQTATYNGDAFTPVTRVVCPVGSQLVTEVLYLLAPDSGSHPVEVTLTASKQTVLGTINYTEAIGIGNYAVNQIGGTYISLTMSTSADNSLLSGIVGQERGGQVFSLNTGTVRWSQQSGSLLADIKAEGYDYTVDATGSYITANTFGATAGDVIAQVEVLVNADTETYTPTITPTFTVTQTFVTTETLTPTIEPTSDVTIIAIMTLNAQLTAVKETEIALSRTPTPTITVSFTITETHTVSPTVTVTPTVTPGAKLLSSRDLKMDTITIDSADGYYQYTWQSSYYLLPWGPSNYTYFVQAYSLPANGIVVTTKGTNYLDIYIRDSVNNEVDCSTTNAVLGIMILHDLKENY